MEGRLQTAEWEAGAVASEARKPVMRRGRTKAKLSRKPRKIVAATEWQKRCAIKFERSVRRGNVKRMRSGIPHGPLPPSLHHHGLCLCLCL
ncbi:hypothetical protein V6N13_076399 [Hibiscus sabdariffa]|uniref:Uncharacterized protein n=1 Tax=Hibiscus sabdariffa TaxID=183260 RepID=A0ABR2AC77_9ROSI